ncbi:hypothetical protein [Kutzneria albida]|uniref:hypothetical protein n=1 Tax=Kutzneria albida TaxID=43357 RepID=UPI0004AD3C3A|nr:hypothetical protein [Kutzneria albida]
MIEWVLPGIAACVTACVAYSTVVTSSAGCPKKRASAYKVLALFMNTLTCKPICALLEKLFRSGGS